MKQGKALKHNVGIAKWYYDELDEMTEEMTSETKSKSSHYISGIC